MDFAFTHLSGHHLFIRHTCYIITLKTLKKRSNYPKNDTHDNLRYYFMEING